MTLLLSFLLILLPALSDPMQPVREAMKEEGHQRALDQLYQIKRDEPEAYQLNGLAYLEAILLKKLGHSGEAASIFEALAGQDHPLHDWILLELIDLRRGEPLERRKSSYEAFLTRYPKHPRWASITLEYGRLLKSEGAYREALLHLDRLWKGKRGSLSRWAALEHALIHLMRNQTREAIGDLQRILKKNENDDVAYRAVQELDRLQRPDQIGEVEARRRARVLMNNRRTAKARVYLEHLIRSYPRSLSQPLYGYLRGRSYVLDGQFSKAIDIYEENYRMHSRSPWGLLCKYRAANTALRMLDYPRAAEIYRYYLDHHPESKYAARSFFNLADTYRWLGRNEEVVATLQEALTKTPPVEHRAFHYSLARLRLESGDYAGALENLQSLEGFSSQQLPSGVTREEIHFWKGEALERLGRAAEAMEAFREAVNGRPNYFAFLARERLPQEVLHTNGVSQDWEGRLVTARAWRNGVSKLKGDPDRIRELLFLGLYQEAALEISRTPDSYFGDQAGKLFNLAYHAREGNLPWRSILAAEKLQQALGGTRPEAYPRILRELLYPRHYWDQVRRYAQEFGVEPELILSIIRQESRFQRDAKSIAAARGLMQFMAATARELSRELGLAEPSESDLYDAELSIRLGAYYFSKLQKQFDGSVEKALAAYNGGSDNVRRWSQKLTRDDPVLFVTNIGFRETKLYVLKVLGNYYAYRALYPQVDTHAASGLSDQTRKGRKSP